LPVENSWTLLVGQDGIVRAGWLPAPCSWQQNRRASQRFAVLVVQSAFTANQFLCGTDDRSLSSFCATTFETASQNIISRRKESQSK